MSIYAYVGLPGSGKSYGVVANQILPALKAGRTVVTNLPLHEDKIREITLEGRIIDFPIDAIKEQPERLDEFAPAGSVLVIDELWKLFPAGSKVDRVPEPFKRLLAEHRHMVDEEGNSTQIVFVTQDLAQIGAFARQLVEQTFLHTKLGHLGMSGRYQVRVYHGHVTGQSPPENRLINQNMGRYDEKVYRLYKSHTMSKSDTEGANEQAVDGRGNIWRRPILWVFLGGGLACLIGGGSFAYSAFQPDPPAARASVATARGPGSGFGIPGTGVPPVPSRSSPESAQGHWRISGYIDGPGDYAVVLLTDGTNTTQLPFHSYCRIRRDRHVDCNIAGQRISSSPLPF